MVVLDLQNVELLVLNLVVWSVVCAAAEGVVSSAVLISRLQVRVSSANMAGARLLVVEDAGL